MTRGFLERIVRAIEAEGGAPAPARHRGKTAPPRLSAAIRHGAARGAVLAEYKRRSPGARSADLPASGPSDFVRRTEPAGPEGYSCLATRPEFRGSPEDVAALVAATPRPVLYKDFVVGPPQLDAAAACGASAVLLIARLETEGLLRTSLAELADAAHRRGLEVLLEWHDPREVNRTEDVPADMYGANSRDLDTLEMRPAVALRTLRAAQGHHPLLGLSGVRGRTEARAFWEAGADGILVGGALARAPDPARLIEELRRDAGRAVK